MSSNVMQFCPKTEHLKLSCIGGCHNGDGIKLTSLSRNELKGSSKAGLGVIVCDLRGSSDSNYDQAGYGAVRSDPNNIGVVILCGSLWWSVGF